MLTSLGFPFKHFNHHIFDQLVPRFLGTRVEFVINVTAIALAFPIIFFLLAAVG